ncbi:MAG: hypothetical protein ACLS6O_04035 [Bifidobacterium sp.]
MATCLTVRARSSDVVRHGPHRAALCGISLFLIGILPDGVSIGISYCISMVGLNMMIGGHRICRRIPEDMRGTMSAFIWVRCSVLLLVRLLVRSSSPCSSGLHRVGVAMGFPVCLPWSSGRRKSQQGYA